MSVAVNLSVRPMLAPGLTDLITATLDRTGVDPDKLSLEVTESVFMKDGPLLRRHAGQHPGPLGVKICIDDFGTGYCSLSYLREFPVDQLKIDKAFVDDLGIDARGSALVAAILAMSEALHVNVTAEGIETAEQVRILQQMSCPRGQGFFLARPMPSAEMDRLVLASRLWEIVDWASFGRIQGCGTVGAGPWHLDQATPAWVVPAWRRAASCRETTR